MAKLCPKATKYATAVTIIQLLILRPRPSGQEGRRADGGVSEEGGQDGHSAW